MEKDIEQMKRYRILPKHELDQIVHKRPREGNGVAGHTFPGTGQGVGDNHPNIIRDKGIGKCVGIGKKHQD